jgi:hypothetical protein
LSQAAAGQSEGSVVGGARAQALRRSLWAQVPIKIAGGQLGEAGGAGGQAVGRGAWGKGVLSQSMQGFRYGGLLWCHSSNGVCHRQVCQNTLVGVSQVRLVGQGSSCGVCSRQRGLPQASNKIQAGGSAVCMWEGQRFKQCAVGGAGVEAVPGGLGLVLLTKAILGSQAFRRGLLWEGRGSG